MRESQTRSRTQSTGQRIGRPRRFDRDAALTNAKRLFWEKGFAGTAISDLATSMGINPPSLYAAFGDKRTLFHEAAESYAQVELAIAKEGLSKSDIVAAMRTYLRNMATLFAGPDSPKGCLLVTGSMNTAPEEQEHMSTIVALRSQLFSRLEDRFGQAVKDKQLRATADISALATYYHAFVHGMAVRAKDGTPLASLLSAVELALMPLTCLRRVHHLKAKA